MGQASPSPRPSCIPLRSVPGAAVTPLPSLLQLFLLLLPAVNTDTETAVVNVTYATKEEAKV